MHLFPYKCKFKLFFLVLSLPQVALFSKLFPRICANTRKTQNCHLFVTLTWKKNFCSLWKDKMRKLQMHKRQNKAREIATETWGNCSFSHWMTGCLKIVWYLHYGTGKKYAMAHFSTERKRSLLKMTQIPNSPLSLLNFLFYTCDTHHHTADQFRQLTRHMNAISGDHSSFEREEKCHQTLIF